MCKDIENHVISQGISSRHQWAFKPGRSTELLMLFLTERWKQEKEDGKVVGVLFLDFRKAFDSINHNTVLMKVKAAGISGSSYYTPGGALDQILVGDVPSRLQKHTRSLYPILKKVYPTLYQFFKKVYPTLYQFFEKVYPTLYISYKNLENRYRSLYQNCEN